MNGLVLEGGAMRGMFTCGVLDVFMEHGVTFNGAIGVSAGATFGCNLKSKQIGRAIRYNLRFAKDPRYCSIRSLIKTGNLYNADFCYRQLPDELDVFDRKTFRENPLEFYLVVTDIESGKPVYFKMKDGEFAELEWMRASASMPLVSKPVCIDGHKYLDGGISDSIPLKYFEQIGYSKNVVILTQPRNYKKKPSRIQPLMKAMLHKYPELYKAMKDRPEAYNAQTAYVFEREAQGSVFVICPEESLGISRTEHNVDELKRVYEMGRKTAEAKLEAVKLFLFS
ncbi:MAG: patatin family protein [Spirochaetaceae bacterium]|nr:patatin family protein [Spirochaetaceae bacterium]